MSTSIDAVAEGRLRAALLGTDSYIGPGRALTLVLASALPDRFELIRSVMEDRGASPDDRVLAASALGRAGGPTSREALLHALSEPDTRVLGSVVKALGWVGDADDYTRLIVSRGRTASSVSMRAEFSTRLIAHRHALPAPELPAIVTLPRLDVPRDARANFEVARATAGRIGACVQALGAHTCGIRIDQEHAYELRCAQSEWLLLLDRRLVASDPALSHGRSLPCVVALRTVETGNYSLALLGLLGPEWSGAGGRLVLCNSTGEPAFDGTLSFAGGKVHFSLHALARPGAFPLLVEGTLDRDGIQLGTLRAGVEPVPVRLPVPWSSTDYRPPTRPGNRSVT